MGSAIWVGGGGQDQCLQGLRWPGRGWALGADTGSRRGPVGLEGGGHGCSPRLRPVRVAVCPRPSSGRGADGVQTGKVQRGGRLSPRVPAAVRAVGKLEGLCPGEERGPNRSLHCRSLHSDPG